MMLEKLLERIAIALEEIVAQRAHPVPEAQVTGEPELTASEISGRNFGEVYGRSQAFAANEAAAQSAPNGELPTVPPAPVGAATLGTVPGGSYLDDLPMIELDADGFPWDERIHTKAKTRVKKTDTWKLARGVDKSVVAQVQEDYKNSQPSGVTTPPITPTPVTAPPVPPAPVTPVPPISTSPADTLTFPEFFKLMAAAGYTADTAKPFLDKHGIAAVPMLTGQPEIMKQIAIEMGIWDAA